MLNPSLLNALATLAQDGLDGQGDGHSPRAVAVLLTLLNRGALPVSTLAAIIGVAQPTATRLVDGLERQGSLRRQAREGRLVRVALTWLGRARAQKLQRERAAWIRRLAAPLSAPEQAELARLLGKLLFAGTASRAQARTTCRCCDHRICRQKGCPVDARASQIESAAGEHT